MDSAGALDWLEPRLTMGQSQGTGTKSAPGWWGERIVKTS